MQLVSTDLKSLPGETVAFVSVRIQMSAFTSFMRSIRDLTLCYSRLLGRSAFHVAILIVFECSKVTTRHIGRLEPSELVILQLVLAVPAVGAEIAAFGDTVVDAGHVGCKAFGPVGFEPVVPEEYWRCLR